ncbi:MAG: ethanolamine ammonia-lyase light chain EutC, partial [Dehalococcoidia bacterium]
MHDLVIDLPEPPRRSNGVPRPSDPARLDALCAATDARIGAGRAGSRPTTAAALRLQADHAAAQDSVLRDVSPELLDQLDLFSVDTEVAGDRAEYLLRPDLGRLLRPEAKRQIRETCLHGPDLQIVAGDGLSAAAVEDNLPLLLGAITREAEAAGLSVGTPFFVRHARVGIMNEIGALLDPRVVILLVGERPGLGHSNSLSAYLA